MSRTRPSLQANWDRRAAANFMAGGSGSGLAVIAAAGAYWSGTLERPAVALAAAAIALGLLFVWLEIGRPWRFLHVFFHPQTSWMTREALLAPPLLLVLAAAAGSGEKALAAFAAFLALAFLYCQARIPRAALGIPAWREPAVVALFVATGFAEGAGLFLALLALAGAVDGPFVPVVALAAIAAREIAWTLYRQSLERRGAPKGALDALKAIDLPVLFLGTLAPFLFIIAALAFPRLAGPLALAAGALALFGGWLIKGVVITRAAFTQGFALPHLSRLAPSARDRSARPGWS
jgi:phenylacetyl-CoA:acceptor oxidoreductase 26-kDa subunit